MIYVCEYDQTTSQETLLQAAGRLPLELPERSLTGVRWEKLRERILAWLLLEYAIGQEYQLGLEELQIRRGAHGKPFSERYPHIWFNISHCSEGCACMVADAPCGVDIERKFPWRESLAKRVTHPEEWNIMEKMEPDVRTDALHRLWSLKESHVKQNGRGIGYGLDQINLARALHQPSGERIFTEQELHYFLYTGEYYTLAACVGDSGLALPASSARQAEEPKLPFCCSWKKEQDLMHGK